MKFNKIKNKNVYETFEPNKRFVDQQTDDYPIERETKRENRGKKYVAFPLKHWFPCKTIR